MNKVSEQRMKLRIEYSRETDLIFSDNIPLYADWLEKKLALSQHDVSGSAYRYPMTYDQPCQIDCRVTSCKFYKGVGKCENVSPAITLNENGKFVCWSQADR